MSETWCSIIQEVVQTVVPTTGQSFVIADASKNIVYLINPAGLLLALTVAMPPNPYDGQIVTISSSAAITGFTLNSQAGGSLINALTSFLLGGFGRWKWNAASSKWWRIG